MDLLKEDKFYYLDRAYRLDGMVMLEVEDDEGSVVETHIGRIEVIYHTNSEGNIRFRLKCEDGVVFTTFVNADTEAYHGRRVLCTPMSDGFLHTLTMMVD